MKYLLAIITYVALIIGAFFVPRAEAAISCQAVLLSDSYELSDSDTKLLATLLELGSRFSYGKTDNGKLLDIAFTLRHRNKGFAKEYEKRLSGRKELPENEELKLLADYEQYYWKTLKNPKALAKLRDHALDVELDRRGAPQFPGVKGRKRLEMLSRQNYERMMKENNLTEDYKDTPWLREQVNGLTLNIFRNSHSTEVYGDGVLSSRQLMECSGSFGMNSEMAFNREFLHTDDNIFFNAEVVKATTTAHSARSKVSEYGKHGVSVAVEEVADIAWVSPYVMFPYDLIEVFKNDQVLNTSFSVGQRFSGSERRDSYQATSYEEAALASLHKYDLTVNDFIALVRAKAAKHIGRYTYEQLVQELGYPRLELKIPVYVPKELFNAQW
jgi:hypothetical protein